MDTFSVLCSLCISSPHATCVRINILQSMPVQNVSRLSRKTRTESISYFILDVTFPLSVGFSDYGWFFGCSTSINTKYI